MSVLQQFQQEMDSLLGLLSSREMHSRDHNSKITMYMQQQAACFGGSRFSIRACWKGATNTAAIYCFAFGKQVCTFK